VVLAQWTLRDFDHTALASDAYVPDPTVLTGWDESFFTLSQGRIWTCHPLPRPSGTSRSPSTGRGRGSSSAMSTR
jgi:hypothetical protein